DVPFQSPDSLCPEFHTSLRSRYQTGGESAHRRNHSGGGSSQGYCVEADSGQLEIGVATLESGFCTSGEMNYAGACPSAKSLAFHFMLKQHFCRQQSPAARFRDSRIETDNPPHAASPESHAGSRAAAHPPFPPARSAAPMRAPAKLPAGAAPSPAHV